jgi:hypothetical protein
MKEYKMPETCPIAASGIFFEKFVSALSFSLES